VLLGGCVLVLLALVLWRPLQQKCLAFFLLRAEAPSEEILSGAVEQASNPSAFLTRLWRTERIPHRQFVISYLGRISRTKSDLFHAMEPLLIEATADPDVETRQLAFSALGQAKHSELRQLSLQQLTDADPGVRLIGLQSLRGIATSNDVPIAMRLLDDPEPRVVVAAAFVLREVIGQDFGIKLSHALPQFTCIDTNPPPAPDLAAINQGVQRWQEWWSSHKAEFPAPRATPTPQRQTPGLAVANFGLEDSSAEAVQLSQFRGKAVLLAFWSTGAPASLDDVPALKALQHRNSDRLTVLGICIPTAPSCADEHEQGHEHAHHHDATSASSSGAEQMRVQVREVVERLKIDFPLLVDAKGAIGPRFKAEDLPVYVLIDDRGRIRRRSVGFRTEQALMAMIEETKQSLSAKQH
jgi:peroxiredoxin